jgi:hypothetical protein
MEKLESSEKFSLLLIVLGIILGAIGAAAAFLVANWLVIVFYAGFLLMIAGFAVAVLSKIGAKAEKK